MLEAVAVPVHLQDVDMVGETIEEGSGKPFRAKDLGQLAPRGPEIVHRPLVAMRGALP